MLAKIVLMFAVATGNVVWAEVCGYVLTKDCTHMSDHVKVCGTDGLSYWNQCQLAQAYCNDNTIHKAHEGPCAVTTTTAIPTSANPVDGSQIALDIFCLDLSYITCPTSGLEICANNGVRYANRCEFDKERCFHRALTEVICT